MKKILAFCFESDRAMMRTALVVPATIILLGVWLEFGLQLSTPLVIVLCTLAGSIVAGLIYLAGRYYYEHRDH